MKKKVIFSLGVLAVLLSAFYWTACQKEVSHEVLPIENQIQNQGTTDRDNECDQCNGDLTLQVATGVTGSHSQGFTIYYAHPDDYEWHVKVEAKTCPGSSWTTVLEFDDDDPKAIGPVLLWHTFNDLLYHDQYYRLTITNESLTPTALYFLSYIRDANTGAVAPSTQDLFPIGAKVLQGETRSFIYHSADGLPNQAEPGWRSNCGCPWNYICGSGSEG